MTLHFTVHPEEDALALRDVLRRRGCSASLLAAVKRGQGFWRAGAPIFANERVRAGDEIAVPLPPDVPSDVTPQDLPLAIVYETAHAMVLEKPAGMVVHPTLGAKDGTLANAFCGLMQRRGTPAPFRPVNRLDRGTSGLVLCAMNAWAAPLLAKSVRKEYLAAVRGVPQPKEGTWRWPIARVRIRSSSAAAPKTASPASRITASWASMRSTTRPCFAACSRRAAHTRSAYMPPGPAIRFWATGCTAATRPPLRGRRCIAAPCALTIRRPAGPSFVKVRPRSQRNG